MLKDGVSVWFLRRLLTSLVKLKIWRVVGVFLRGTFWSEPNDLSEDCEAVSRPIVSAVPVVSAVLFSPSSVVTECFDDVSLDPYGNLLRRSHFSPRCVRSLGRFFKKS